MQFNINALIRFYSIYFNRYRDIKRITYFFILIIFFSAPKIKVLAQSYPPKTLHAGELQLALKKLNVLGSALYVAAHPDDENTALIAYLANDRLMRTAYLSLTRGDGGQNLIGPEQSELMGFIRTHELIQARRTDGGEQFFTRANDFGFSKNAQESLEIWSKEKVLADVVWTIRKLRPDVIINRFPPNRDAGHGHHEASAILAIEAFKAAADPSRFPEQLRFVQPWQAKRIIWNAFSFRRGNFSNVPPDSANSVVVNIGSYNPLLGKSHLVIAAESRSMHRSQGFGSGKSRGNRIDYLLHIDGVKAEKDIVDAIDLSWNRVENSQEIAQLLQDAYKKFNPENPAQVVPFLLKAYQLMEKHPKKSSEAKYWIEQKQEELKNILLNLMGLWLEATSNEFAVCGGDSIQLNIEAVNRSGVLVVLDKVEIFSKSAGKIQELSNLSQKLNDGELFNPKIKMILPNQEEITQPYWLIQPLEKGMYQIPEREKMMLGSPENTSPLQAIFHLKIENIDFVFQRGVNYKWTKPDEGELYRSFEVTPEVMVNLDHETYMFGDDIPKEIFLTVKSGKANLKGEVNLQVPEGWKTVPSHQLFDLKNKGQEVTLKFSIIPSSKSPSGTLQVFTKTTDNPTSQKARGIRNITYPHIPILSVYPIAEARLEKLNIKTNGKKIGYIDGAGDEMPQYLSQIGYKVTLISEREMKEDLMKFDAIVVGVRAYNTVERLKFDQEKLMNYVKNGGTLLVQYQTNARLVTPQIGPYPFVIGRERVTVENAPVEFTNPEHPILNYPNKISQKDFEGWVQERGLYFAQSWDNSYQTVISSKDPGEKDLQGGILVADFGKGKFVYTGLAFFRQFPSGVVGAYRLFANLIAK